MSKTIEVYNLIFKTVLLGTVFLLPLFFLNLTSEFYDTPKFLLLAIVTAVLLILWSVKWILEGNVSLSITPLNLPLLLLVLTAAVATVLSPNNNTGVLANLPNIQGSLISLAVYVLFYLVVAANIKTQASAKHVIYTLICSEVLLCLVSILSYFGIDSFALSFTKTLNFSPTGSSFAAVSLLTLTLPFLIVGLLSEQNTLEDLIGDSEVSPPVSLLISKFFLLGLLALFLITIVLLGSASILIAAVLVMVLSLYATSSAALKKNLVFLIAPLALSILLVIITRLPVGGSRNFLYAKAQNFPRELQLPFVDSWKISVSAFRDNPFWGTGPGTYLADFTAYKPIEFNSSILWNNRFNNAFNEYLQVLAQNGAIGLIALLLFSAVTISLSFRMINFNQHFVFSKALGVVGLTMIILLALHTGTLLLWIIGLLLLSLSGAFYKDSSKEVNLGLAAVSIKNNQTRMKADILVIVLPLVILAVVLAFGYFFSKFVLADYHHRQAIKAYSENNGLLAYNEFTAARNFNPNSDLYRIDLAQANFAIANAIATAKGPTEASPAGSLTDTDKQNIQTLLTQAIDEGKNAVALNPRSVVNYEILAAIYQQISGVAQNAAIFSLDSYGRAIQQDPLNPLLRITVGSMYYAGKNYDMAVRFFTDAINLKPDLAGAYYNLALVWRDKGDLESARLAAEKSLSLIDQKSNDYQIVNNLLTNIKDALTNKAAELSVTPTPTPAVSPLENKKMPKVLNLPKPEQIASPEAVQKP